MTTIQKQGRTLVLLMGIYAMGIQPLHATVLIYEGFKYPLANNANMNGVAATGFGVQGNWAVTNDLPKSGSNSGSASSVYQTSGLSFGSAFAATSGGAIKLNTNYNWGKNAKTTATVQLNATSSGTVWCGYLVNYAAIGNANGGHAREGVATEADGAGINLVSQLTSNQVASDRKLSVSYDSTLSTSGNISFATGTTYLYLSRYTNVGLPLSAEQTGVATTWVMTQTQFEDWVGAGASEATLGNYDTVALSDTATSGTYAFNSTGFLTLQADAPDYNNTQVNAIYDEIRYGTKLKDVYNPDPAASLIVVK